MWNIWFLPGWSGRKLSLLPITGSNQSIKPGIGDKSLLFLYIIIFIHFFQKMNLNLWGWNNGILLPKLFWPTARKNCSSDREKLLKFEAEGREFFKIFEITWRIYSNSERSEQFLVAECFFNLFQACIYLLRICTIPRHNHKWDYFSQFSDKYF